MGQQRGKLVPLGQAVIKIDNVSCEIRSCMFLKVSLTHTSQNRCFSGNAAAVQISHNDCQSTIVVEIRNRMDPVGNCVHQLSLNDVADPGRIFDCVFCVHRFATNTPMDFVRSAFRRE